MDQKNITSGKSFAAGILVGFMVLCTIGFFILLGVYINDRKVNNKNADEVGNEVDNTQVEPQVYQVQKSDKPKAELFVMSHCPYGLQMEKAYLPVWKLLGNKADMSVKFVYYAMHGLKEVQEQLRQHCVAAEQADKYIPYLECFVLGNTSEECLSQAGVDQSKLQTCYDSTDKTYGIMDKYNDESSWISGRFAPFPIYNALNDAYKVQGSPTLVINGAQIQTPRNPESVKQAICQSFNNPPKECDTVLSSASASVGFGGGAGSDTAGAGCATQ